MNMSSPQKVRRWRPRAARHSGDTEGTVAEVTVAYHLSMTTSFAAKQVTVLLTQRRSLALEPELTRSLRGHCGVTTNKGACGRVGGGRRLHLPHRLGWGQTTQGQHAATGPFPNWRGKDQGKVLQYIVNFIVLDHFVDSFFNTHQTFCCQLNLKFRMFCSKSCSQQRFVSKLAKPCFSLLIGKHKKLVIVN